MSHFDHCGCGPVAPVAKVAPVVSPVVTGCHSNVGVVLVLFILLVIILRAFWC
ncbi:hypothetical protein GRF59_13260 [Paenibacillus sp. HJL G12]|uniref:Sporulation protein YjcZ n=1 Tax=Paenibacillus dendrobii TaxID=2691084 RepID=A0A7X3IM68_9BACL|nr:hypothetical protein [Paenibacillus dendrobii]MWV44597.1 hypothetical protein [Paenibacillus dendrobii]